MNKSITMYMWQERHLKAPPVCTMQLDLDCGISDILKEARQVLEQGTKITAVHKSLGCEIFIVKKINYKSNASLHNEKALQGIRQLERSLRRLVEISPTTLMKSLLDNWPSVLNLHYGAIVYLPSRQMLQYALVQMVGCTALLHQIINRAVLTFTHAMDQVRIGMQTKNMLVFAAAASRVWYLCRSMKAQLSSWYDRLRPLVDILKPTKAQWLKDGFEFPTDLLAWLGKELGMPPHVMKGKDIPAKNGHEGFEIEPENEFPMMPDDSIGGRDKQHTHAVDFPSVLILEDVGEVVQRDQSTKQNKKQRHAEVRASTDDTAPPCDITNDEGHLEVPDGEALFSLPFWFGKIEKCKKVPLLLKVLKSFRKKFQIKSKRIKDCCQHLDTDGVCTKAHKKLTKSCLQTVARLQIKKMKKGKAVEGQKENVKVTNEKVGTRDGQVSSGDDKVAYESSVSRKTPSVDTNEINTSFVEHLTLKMVRPKGVRETLRDVDQGHIVCGAIQWEISGKTVKRVKKLLRECLRSLKGKTKPDRKAIILKTVQHLELVRVGSKVGKALSKDGREGLCKGVISKTEKPKVKKKVKGNEKPKKVHPDRVSVSVKKDGQSLKQQKRKIDKDNKRHQPKKDSETFSKKRGPKQRETNNNKAKGGQKRGKRKGS